MSPLRYTVEVVAVKAAALPTPSAPGVGPPPARRDVCPWGATKRTRMLRASATTRTPLGSKARPLGVLKSAFVPKPSAYPMAPLPASVPRAPPGTSQRIRFPAPSEIKTTPLAFTTRALGLLRVPAVATAASSEDGAPVPAMVLTPPVASVSARAL